jgi:chromosome segregation protein
MPLRLKSLELHGYKTFAARTLFEFAEGITAIVGPNGSGKSNIADALRWVLGEQSYSLLRAKRTEDMIFSGSEQRTRAGMASVSILFDNEDNWLPIDFSEVGLTRRAYRDGNNEYLLNGQRVRLREINELLAQSGLGERTYTILGQGLVDASLALKADDRRRLFEEAAGVGLYRTRREEALRRLDTTQRNLERVMDIMAELEPRLRSLERQARKAKEYAQAQADLRLLLLDWYGYHWHRAQKELTDTRETVRQHEASAQEARQAHDEIQQEHAAFRERLQGLRSQLSEWHRQSAELHRQRETTSRELAVLDERQRAFSSSQQSLQVDLDRNRDEEELASDRLSEVEAETARLQSEYDEAQGQLASAQEALQVRQAERAAVEGKLDSARKTVANLHTRRAESQARLDELASRIEVQGQKLESTERVIQATQSSLSDLDGRRQSALAERQAAEGALEQAERELKAQQEKTANLEQTLRREADERAARQTEHSRLKAQLEVLEQAEQSLSGYAEGARFLLQAARQAHLKGARGALSTALEVPSEYEAAIAAALGDRLDAVLLESGRDVEEALRLLEGDSAGRAAILPLEWLAKASPLKAPQDPDCLGLAADLVGAPDALRPAVNLILGRTMVVRDRATARRIIQGQPDHTQAVTLRGEVFYADGSILAGKQARGGTLSRPRQRRELQANLADLDKRLTSLDESLQRLSDDLAEAQQKQDRLEEALSEARAALEKALEAEQQSSLELESARRQYEWQQSQRQQLQAEVTQAEKEQTELTTAQAEVEAESATAQDEIRVLSTELASLALDEAQEQVTYWSTRAAVAERALSDAQARQSERREDLDNLKTQQGGLQRRLEQGDQSLKDLEGQKEELRTQESSLNGQLEALQTQIVPAEKDLETAELQEIEYQKKETEAQRAMTNVERMYSQVQVVLARRQEGLDALRQRIQDDFGLVVFEYATDVAGPVPLPFDGMVEQLPLVTQLPLDLEENLTQQRARLRRMGPINPEAQQEYDSGRERYEFLKTQMEDSRKAEADLRQVIAELDELTKRDFHETFQAVADEFRQIFVRLFGGGSAKLLLTEPENLIETGIEIEARLPGRREQGLALLSGGERSLTAIALVFALLKVSPTPVCVMDEVDAMLDEANIGRFREMLTELSQDTQFVIITHNRNTVQAAQAIYGVTMGRDSTSQVISLRLDEVSDELFRE